MNVKNILTISGIIALSTLLAPVITRAQGADGTTGRSEMSCCQMLGAAPAGAKSVKSPKSAVPTAKDGVQRATVTIDGGYSPASLSVKAGKPVEITFVRKSASGCDGTLVIPDLKFQKTLKQGEKTVVKFTPKKTGSIGFQCGMAMYKGQIAVK